MFATMVVHTKCSLKRSQPLRIILLWCRHLFPVEDFSDIAIQKSSKARAHTHTHARTHTNTHTHTHTHKYHKFSSLHSLHLWSSMYEDFALTFILS